VPKAKLKQRTRQLAKTLMEKNPTVLRQAKTAFRYSSRMSWDEAADYLFAKSDQSSFLDPERGREEGMRQFLDEKTYKPGLGSYKRKR
jgi:trans-feruloyl-CoA hydratase/vanillin synthase